MKWLWSRKRQGSSSIRSAGVDRVPDLAYFWLPWGGQAWAQWEGSLCLTTRLPFSAEQLHARSFSPRSLASPPRVSNKVSISLILAKSLFYIELLNACKSSHKQWEKGDLLFFLNRCQCLSSSHWYGTVLRHAWWFPDSPISVCWNSTACSGSRHGRPSLLF